MRPLLLGSRCCFFPDEAVPMDRAGPFFVGGRFVQAAHDTLRPDETKAVDEGQPESFVSVAAS